MAVWSVALCVQTCNVQNPPAISLAGLSKLYACGRQALSNITLDIPRGEIFALLGSNGAGKTTLIHSICGIVHPTAGSVLIDGLDSRKHKVAVSRKIGLVQQELTHDALERVEATIKFSRALYGKSNDQPLMERLLRDLSLTEVRKQRVMTLSGGMKRRVMIAKALVHEPEILFLDEPTAGVDVEARQAIWSLIGTLRRIGVTIILTTHYIEEAETIADRVGVIHRGEIVLVEQTQALLKRFGEKQLVLQLARPLDTLPAELEQRPYRLEQGGQQLVYSYHSGTAQSEIDDLLRLISAYGISVLDLQSRQRTLEEIFVNLISAQAA